MQCSSPHSIRVVFAFDLTHTPLTALRKQTSPNWIAYFFNTDQSDYDAKLQRILQEHSASGNSDSGMGGGANCKGQEDDRLRYINIPADQRPQVRSNCPTAA